jgi:hypothetical protein
VVVFSLVEPRQIAPSRSQIRVTERRLDLTHLRASIFHRPREGMAQGVNLTGAETSLTEIGNSARGERVSRSAVGRQAHPDWPFSGSGGRASLGCYD